MSSGKPLPPGVAAALERVALLVERLESGDDPPAPAEVGELIRDIDAIHRPGLRRLFALIGEAGLERRALDDEEISLLFHLYGLDEDGERVRAERVLEVLGADLAGHGAQLALLEAGDDWLKVELSAVGVGRAHLDQVGQRLEYLLLDWLPGMEGVEVVVSDRPTAQPPAANFIPLANLQPGKARGVVWEPAMGADELGEGQVREAQLRGQSMLIARVDSEFYAYRNVCPDTSLPLTDGEVRDRILTCPWHRCRFDLRGGRRIGATGPGLGVVPVRVIGEEVRLGRLELGGS